jgi:DNA-binding MarR family transcriptional regulator
MKNQSHYSLRQLRKQPEFILTQLQNELYRALTAYMEQHGLSKKDMAAKLGVSPSYVSTNVPTFDPSPRRSSYFFLSNTARRNSAPSK